MLAVDIIAQKVEATKQLLFIYFIGIIGRVYLGVSNRELKADEFSGGLVKGEFSSSKRSGYAEYKKHTSKRLGNSISHVFSFVMLVAVLDCDRKLGLQV